MVRLNPTLAETAKFTQMLAETPERIRDLTDGLRETLLRQPPGEREWSVVEVLAHLRACAGLWTYSIYAMLTEKEPELALIDARGWAKAARLVDTSFAGALQAFSLQRAGLLNVLQGLQIEGWERRAIVAGRGMSVFSQARRMALHEAEHCRQIETVCARLRTTG